MTELDQLRADLQSAAQEAATLRKALEEIRDMKAAYPEHTPVDNWWTLRAIEALSTPPLSHSARIAAIAEPKVDGLGRDQILKWLQDLRNHDYVGPGVWAEAIGYMALKYVDALEQQGKGE